MSFIAGDIMIRMAADVASLKTDMQKAESAVSTAFDNMKTAAKALGGLFAVSEIAAWAKAAIDAGDDAKTLADRVGLTVKEVTALSAAFKAGGSNADGVKTSLTKLSKEVYENEGLFRALGIEVKSIDGEYRKVDQILGDVADVFKDMPDGVTKTKLATELFGKSGADLIPVLNDGKKGLEDMKDEAKKFGAAIDDDAVDAADDFNDKLGLLKDAAIATTLNGLTPILKALTDVGTIFGTFGKETKDATDKISPLQTAAVTAVQAISALTLNVGYVFKAFGTEIGVIAAQIVAFMSGDFAGAKKIGQEWTEDAKKMREEVDKATTALLSAGKEAKNHGDELDKAKPKIGGNAEEMAKAALRAKELEEKQKKAAEEAKKHSDELDKMASALKAEQAGLSPDFFKKLGDLKELRSTGRISVDEYAKAVKDLTDKQPAVKAQAEAEKKALEDLEKAQAAVATATSKYEKAIADETEAMRKSNVELKDQNEKAGLNATQLAAREAALLRQKAEEKDWAASMYEEGTGSNWQLKEQARLLRERADMVEDGALVKEAKATADEWAKTTKTLEDGLTDALMRGFESGKGFMDNIKDYIKNAFKTLVADFIVRPVMAPISGALASLFSGNAMAGQGGGVGGVFSSLMSSGMNLLNGNMMGGVGLDLVNSALGQKLGLSSLQNIGGNMIAGPTGLGSLVGSGLGMLGNGFMGYGISKALSGGYSAGGGINAIAGIASAIPGIGPIAGVVGGLINRAFGMKAKEMKDAGITGTITGGDATGQRFQDWFQKGGWFRSNKSGTEFSALGDDLSAALDLGASGVLNQTKAWASALKLPAETLAQVTYDFRTKLTGNAEEDKNAIALVFEGYQNKLTQSFESVIKPFQQAGETIADTMQRLVSLSEVSTQLNTLGGIFSKVAAASIEARENIIGLAGGIEQLIEKAGQFVKDYYTVEEQAGLQAQSALQVLRDLGLDATTITSREDFRNLVESIDVSTQNGQEQLVALLNIAPTFASLADYIKENNTTLADVAKQAPVVAVLDKILPESVNTAEAVGTVADRITEGNATLERIVTAIQTGNLSISTGLEALAAAQQTVANLQSQIVANTAATAAATTSTATGAALSNSSPTYGNDVGSFYNVDLVAAGN